MGMDFLDYTFRLEKEFAIKIPDKDISQKQGEEYMLVLATFGDWQEYLCSKRPDLDPIDVDQRHRSVLVELLAINHEEAMAIKTTDRLIEDLQFE